MIKYRFAVATFFLVILLCLLSFHIDEPWSYRHDDNGALYSSIARTHALKGLQATRGQDFLVSRVDGHLIPYLHHPPLLGLYLAAAFRVAGKDTPLIARMSVTLLHALSFIVFCFIVFKVFGNRTWAAVWAMMVFTVAPLSTFFGKMPNHEPIALLFLLCGIYSYLAHSDGRPSDRRWLAAGAFSWMLAIFSSWQAAFMIAGVALHGLWSKNRQGKSFGLMTWIVSFPALLLVLAQMLWANHGNLLATQQQSLGIWLLPRSAQSYLAYFSQILINAVRYSGILPPIFSAAWLITFLQRKEKEPAARTLGWLLIFPAAGSVLFNLLFAKAGRFHPYHQLYWLPFIAIQSAWAVEAIRDRLAPHHRWLPRLFYATSLMITIGASAFFLSQFYSHPNPYAVAASENMQKLYY